MRYRGKRIARYVFSIMAATCLVGDGVSLAGPDDRAAAAAPAAAAPAHAAPVAAPAGPARSSPAPRSAEPSPAPTAIVAPNQPTGVAHPTNNVQSGRNVVDRDGDHHHHDRGNANLYFPLGYAYAYFDPGWSPFGYDQTPYPAPFDQTDADVSQPQAQSVDASAAVVTPPQAPDTPSAALNAALMASPQWRQADAQVRIAQAEYDTAKSQVLAQLQTQPAYQQALARKQQDAQKVESLKAKDPAPSIERAAPIATAKLDAAQAVTQMESAALLADPQASAAKVKLDVAIARRDEARQAAQAALPKSTPNAAR